MRVRIHSRYSKKIGQTRTVFTIHVERHSFDDTGEYGEIDFGGFPLNETSLCTRMGFCKESDGCCYLLKTVIFKISR
jgi:hypothetical protein